MFEWRTIHYWFTNPKEFLWDNGFWIAVIILLSAGNWIWSKVSDFVSKRKSTPED